jgi:hypothetical protein
MDLKIVELQEQPTAVVREQVAVNALPEFFGRAFAAVSAAMEAQGVQPAGPPFALYRGMPTEIVDVEAGFPVSTTVAAANRVRAGTYCRPAAPFRRCISAATTPSAQRMRRSSSGCMRRAWRPRTTCGSTTSATSRPTPQPRALWSSGRCSEAIQSRVRTQSLRPKAAMLMKPQVLRQVLSDARSGQVVFVSHCMLNQNVRYLGGATRPGAVAEVVARLQRAGVGIVQMPCPEQRAWGGVDKRYTMPAYGADQTRFRRLRRPASWLFLLHTRLAYRRLAGQVARDIGDYVRSGQSYRRWMASAARLHVACAPRWISRGCWTPSQAVTPAS